MMDSNWHANEDGNIAYLTCIELNLRLFNDMMFSFFLPTMPPYQTLGFGLVVFPVTSTIGAFRFSVSPR